MSTALLARSTDSTRMIALSAPILTLSPRREVTHASVTLSLAASTSFPPSSHATCRPICPLSSNLSPTLSHQSTSLSPTGSSPMRSLSRCRTLRALDRLSVHFSDMILELCETGMRSFKLFKHSPTSHTSNESRKIERSLKCTKISSMQQSRAPPPSSKVNLPH